MGSDEAQWLVAFTRRAEVDIVKIFAFIADVTVGKLPMPCLLASSRHETVYADSRNVVAFRRFEKYYSIHTE